MIVGAWCIAGPVWSNSGMVTKRQASVRRRWTACLSSLAVLFAALAPSVSMALAGARGDIAIALLEICTVVGSRSGVADVATVASVVADPMSAVADVDRPPLASSPTGRSAADPQLPSPPHAAGGAHCPYCLLTHAWLGPPPAPALPAAVAPGNERRAPFAIAPRVARAASPGARPRAPPVPA